VFTYTDKREADDKGNYNEAMKDEKEYKTMILSSLASISPILSSSLNNSD
jgi:hypothetical protein